MSGVHIPAMPLFYWVATLGKLFAQSLLGSKKLGYKMECSDWTDLMA